MTFGIDIAGYQSGMDLVKAKAEGVEFVIVKASGFNVSPLYVASGYHAHIDNAIAAGLPKGHYYLIGGGQEWKTPTEQARWFVANLYRFNILTDVLMLDNEGLNANGYLFDDAEAAEFIREVIALTGIRPNRVWHYAGARDYRALQPWPLTEASGVRFVWAAYGSYPTGQTPDHQPSLQGSLSRWDVHQFTSLSSVAGKSVDGNYSPHPVTDLFGRIDVAYSNVNNFIVILADNRDPWVSWDNHLARGSAGGVDCVARIGTPIYAPDDCVLANTPNNGTGGNTITLSFASGWRDQMMHLSRFVAPGSKRRGELVGYSGDSGSPGAPHVHWHRIDTAGRRQNPWNYFTTSGTAGGGTTPIEEDDMFTDDDRAKLNSVHSGLYFGGPAVPGGGSIVALIDGIASRVWATNVDRGLDASGNPVLVSALQELADAKTIGMRLEGQVAALTSAVGALAIGAGADPAAILAAAREGAEQAIADDFEGLRARLAKLPDEVRAALKEAL